MTKPFQSIRRLIDRVGALVTSPPPVEKESPTAELPKVEEPEDDEAFMDTYQLEVTTADTLPLEQALTKNEHQVEQPAAATESLPREEKMGTETRNDSDLLLDLGEPVHPWVAEEEEFVLDLDDESAAPAYAAAPARTFVEPQVTEAVAAAGAYESSYQPEVHASFADTQEVPYPSAVSDVEVVESEPEPMFAEPQPSSATTLTTDQLTPEMIDAIARRVVEMMSDKVVREIAWEVVPDLAELLIKQQLEKTK